MQSDVETVAATRVAVVAPDPVALSGAVREAGGEPVASGIPEGISGRGVALRREWVADRLEVWLLDGRMDAVLFEADADTDLAGILLASIRLGIPAVCASPPDTPFAAAVAALGFTVLDGESPAKVATSLVRDIPDGTGVGVDNFSVANAIRVGLSLGGGAEMVMHIAAIGRQAGVVGFRRMLEVLVTESVPLCLPGDEWFRKYGIGGILDDLSEELHDAQTVSGGPLSAHAVAAEDQPPGAGFGYSFIQARSSRAEMICHVPDGVEEFTGRCQVFETEEEACAEVPELASGEEATIVVVRRCGAKGEPGVRVLDDLARVIREGSLEENLAIITDGLAPEDATGVWASAFAPEAASSGVIGRLEDGDLIKLDFVEGRILTSVPSKDLARRRLARLSASKSPAYVARYARSARAALDGGGFG